LFRDYGFVEPFPQTWILDEWAFELDVFEEDGDAPTEILLGWITELPHQPGYRSELIKYLQQLHTKLMKTRNQAINLHYHNKDSTVPLDEWNLILNYHEAIADALAMAYNSFLGNENDWLDTSIDDNVCSNVEECASISHYDSLQQEDDDLDYISPTCYNGEWMQFNDYDDVEILKTSYQNAKFNHNPTTGDVCMDLDTILQICSSYRPHYHEFVSHFPARFIDTLKRVVFVGGGDSMLLHEALQYPTIEKVVGLELDQTVTRKCFKYFQTQPHFDDDRVEWWFGDATKSLLLLPKEYWGSFDLVLVDLSETVMALSVTDDLDVFDALALLLKPEGVMVKNEIYMEDMSKVFDYTIQIHYDSPKICSQMLVMGSNRVDFFHQPQKDHNLNHHLLLPLDKIYDRFEYMHDYRKNDARLEGKCDLPPQKETTDEQDKRAGILYVMDVENITALDIKLEEFLYEAVQGADLTPISTPSSDDASVAVVVLKEGFAIGRFWPEEKYAAVGIHLWGSHHKAAVLENHLMTGFQTSSLSSFRVVVGGMYGSTTWTEDQSIIGPQIVQNRNCDIPSTSISDAVVADAEVPRVVVDEFLNLVHSGNLVIGVVCGFQESEDTCVTNEIVEANPNVDQVITFWACPDLNQKSNSNVSSILPQMFACENAMIQQLDEAMDEGDLYFDMFAIDSSAPYEMAQIFNSVWSTPKYRSWYIAKEHNLFLGISLNPKEEDYQRNFLDRYRKDVRDDPTTRAEIIIHQGSTSMEVGVVSVGDEFIFHNLHIVERKIQQRLGENVDVDLRKINGGQWKFKEDYEPREFSHEDYDTAPGLQQFHNQKPLGRETIFQFLLNTEKDGATMPSLGDLTKYLEQTLSKLRFTHTKSTVFTEVGDGVVIVSISKEGSAVLVWDGRDHVDVNLFNRVDRQELADAFSNSFVHFANKNLKVALRDDYPRGTGRVVNFYRDITVPDDGAPKM
jgi:spermidine synthase